MLEQYMKTDWTYPYQFGTEEKFVHIHLDLVVVQIKNQNVQASELQCIADSAYSKAQNEIKQLIEANPKQKEFHFCIRDDHIKLALMLRKLGK